MIGNAQVFSYGYGEGCFTHSRRTHKQEGTSGPMRGNITFSTEVLIAPNEVGKEVADGLFGSLKPIVGEVQTFFKGLRRYSNLVDFSPWNSKQRFNQFGIFGTAVTNSAKFVFVYDFQCLTVEQWIVSGLFNAVFKALHRFNKRLRFGRNGPMCPCNQRERLPKFF